MSVISASIWTFMACSCRVYRLLSCALPNSTNRSGGDEAKYSLRMNCWVVVVKRHGLHFDTFFARHVRNVRNDVTLNQTTTCTIFAHWLMSVAFTFGYTAGQILQQPSPISNCTSYISDVDGLYCPSVCPFDRYLPAPDISSGQRFT